MTEQFSVIVFVLVAVAFLAGVQGERLRARWARRRWKAREARGVARKAPRERAAPQTGRAAPAWTTDAAAQLRLVMKSTFRRRPLLSPSEARVLRAAEKAVKELDLNWRVMAQVSLGEVLATQDQAAYGAINSKRVDMLLVSEDCGPIAAIEYQGAGHYQGDAAARDAVKKEALRLAGVRMIEITSDHTPAHLAREIARIAEMETD